jgi:hypothetical protein
LNFKLTHLNAFNFCQNLRLAIFFASTKKKVDTIPEETGTGQRLPTEDTQVVFPPVRSAAASLIISNKNVID